MTKLIAYNLSNLSHTYHHRHLKLYITHHWNSLTNVPFSIPVIGILGKFLNDTHHTISKLISLYNSHHYNKYHIHSNYWGTKFSIICGDFTTCEIIIFKLFLYQYTFYRKGTSWPWKLNCENPFQFATHKYNTIKNHNIHIQYLL